jgi:hypothetical protein
MAKEKLISINDVASIDESNYLKVDYRAIGKESGNAEFEAGVQSLWSTREAIAEIVDLGLLERGAQPISNYYLEAVRWLKGQAATASWVNIPPFGQSDRAAEMSQFLSTWLPNYLNTFFANTIAASFYIETVKARRHLTSKNVVQQIENETEAAVEKITSDGIEVLGQLKQSADATITEVETRAEAIRQFVTEQKEELNKTVALQSLTTWAKFYTKRVKEYEALLNGPEPLNPDKPANGWLMSWQNRWFWSIKYSVVAQWLRSLKARRIFWFVLLVAMILVFVAINTGFIHLSLDDEIRKQVNNPILYRIGVSAPLLLIPSLGYAFSNKNYRIYANLLEQYRHREVVAETLTGIIATLGNDPSNADIRQQLTAVGAQAIFEQKNIGHLSKHENEGMFAEITQFLRAR